ncbi:MAG: DUF6701 domain-containing protein [Ignavibacteria bacterium]
MKLPAERTGQFAGCHFGAVVASVAMLLLGGGALAASQTYSTAGTYTWTAPTGVTSVTVEAWGGGGAGGAATGNPSAGGGGAGGQYASKSLTVTPGTSYTIVVGAGGAGGSGNGGTGGDSTFNGTSVVAKGGAGGSAATTSIGVGAGGTGSSAGGVGSTVYAGGSGSGGATFLGLWITGSGAGGGGAGSTGAGGNASGTSAGSGTANGGGDGAAGLTGGGTGNAGSAAGGGGSGGWATSNADRNGGSGAAGQVTLTWVQLPSATTGSATSVTGTTATLNGSFTSNGATTSTYFQYGVDTSYGTQVAGSPSSLSSTATNTAVSASLSNLACGTTYHFRAHAHNSDGDGYGNDATFTTPTCPVVLAKSTTISSGAVGSYVTFTITATNLNAGTALTSVVVTDALPSGMSYASASASLGVVSSSSDSSTVTWSLAYLPPSTSATLSLVVKLTASGTLTNTVTSPGATSASANIVSLPGGIVHYRMDETVGGWKGTTGEVADDGPQQLNGTRLTITSPTTTNTVSPSPTIASQYSSVIGGGFCNAGKFDGNAVVQTPNNSFFQFTTALSASAWIYPTCYPTTSGGCSSSKTSLGTGANQYLRSILSNDVNYEFHINSDGKLYWWWQLQNSTSCTSSGTAYIMNSSATIPLNTWTHVAITFDSTSANHRQRIYINGVLDSEVTTNPSGTLVKNLCPMYVGGDITTDDTAYGNCKTPACNLISSRAFVGMIDEPKIYAYELGASEVQADMTLGRLCSGTYDHIQLEYSGSASICKSKTVTVKVCMDSGCTSLYPGTVSLQLTPTGWTPSDTMTISGGMAQATLSNSAMTSSTLTLGATNVSPAANSAVVCTNGTTKTCTMTVDQTACTSIFDAVEKSANPGTHLYTKLAGTAFNVDLVALLSAGSTTVDPNYIGTVTYDVVDTSSTACPNGAALTSAQTANFAAADLGRKNVQITCCGTSSPYKLAKSARVRMKLGATSTYACSSDLFAVRPLSPTLTPTSTMATPPSPTATPTLKAGSSFTFTAASATQGYADGSANSGGSLSLVTSRLSYQDPNADAAATTPTYCTGSPCKGALGSLTPTTIAIGSNSAAYSEVGYLYLAEGAYVDSEQSFTAVDRSAGDCVANSASTTLTTDNKYGCDVGTAATSFGRFVPDHLGTAIKSAPMACSPVLTSCPAGGMMYSGQSFTSAVTAYAAGGTATQNYMGNFARAVTLTAWDAKGSTATNRTASPGPLTSSDSGGTSLGNVLPASYFAAGATSSTTATTPTHTYIFTAASPFALTSPTNVYLRATDADGVTSLAASNPATASVEQGIAVVNGRLRLSSNSGSAKTTLDLTAQAQYWNGNTWVLSSTDTTTGPALATSAVALSNYTGTLSSSNVGALSFVAGPTTGMYKLRFAAPTGAATGSVDVAVNLGSGTTDQSCVSGTHPTTTGLALPWLRSQNGTCTNSTNGIADPSARATFGIYQNKTVHSRELY